MKRLRPLSTLLAVSVALCAVLLFDNITRRSTPALKLDLDFPRSQPDVTAVLLNWARFPNVVQIVSVLCGPALDAVIKVALQADFI
jgi:hypothetical protein